MSGPGSRLSISQEHSRAVCAASQRTGRSRGKPEGIGEPMGLADRVRLGLDAVDKPRRQLVRGITVTGPGIDRQPTAFAPDHVALIEIPVQQPVVLGHDRKLGVERGAVPEQLIAEPVGPFPKPRGTVRRQVRQPGNRDRRVRVGAPQPGQHLGRRGQGLLGPMLGRRGARFAPLDQGRPLVRVDLVDPDRTVSVVVAEHRERGGEVRIRQRDLDHDLFAVGALGRSRPAGVATRPVGGTDRQPPSPRVLGDQPGQPLDPLLGARMVGDEPSMLIIVEEVHEPSVATSGRPRQQI
ncbi:hypothetical protein GCM10028864_30370 [Microlunatus parietis]